MHLSPYRITSSIKLRIFVTTQMHQYNESNIESKYNTNCRNKIIKYCLPKRNGQE